MRRVAPAALVAAFVLALFAAPGRTAQARSTGPDSFLPYRAESVEDLVAQVESNEVVRKRFAKHFHMSEAELVQYFRTQLRVVEITQSGTRPVYGVTRIGRIYRTRGQFRKGAKAFGLPDGTPILKFSCANPLVASLPPVKRKEVVEVPPVPVELPREVHEIVIPPPPLHEPEEVALLVDLPQAPYFQVPIEVERERRLPFWLLAALIPRGGDGNGHVIPEPSSLILFGTGLAALGSRFLRRRR